MNLSILKWSSSSFQSLVWVLMWMMISPSVFGQSNARSCSNSYRSYISELSREQSSEGNSVSYELTVYYNGYKTYGLSHVTIGVPCGTVTEASNSKGFPMELNSVDPHSGTKGIKVDDINNFGEDRGKNSQFTVQFTLLTGDPPCYIGKQEINVFYKAGRSTFSEEHSVEGFNLHENPTNNSTATIIDNQYEYCLGDINELTVQLTGSCPWLLTYSVDGVVQTAVVSEELYYIPVTIAGVYKLLTVQDENGNFGTVIGEVLIVEPPYGEIFGGGTICQGESAELVFEFSGTGPWTFQYTDGINQYVETSDLDRTVITTTEPGQYRLLEISNGICAVEGSDKIVEVNVIEIKAKISGGGDILPGETAILTFEMTGDGPWDVYYSNGSEDFHFETTENLHTVEVTAPGEYKIIEASNSACSTTGEGIAVVYELPTATIESDNIELCDGATGEINLQLSGNGPWWIVYTYNGTEKIIQGIDTELYTLEVTEPGVYELVKVYDNNQKEGTASGVVEVSEAVTPSATISGGGSICEGNELEVVISLEGDGPWTFRYSYNNEIHSVTTDENSYQLVVTEDARIEVLFVSNGTCSKELQGVVAEVEVSELPTVTLSGGGTFFEGETATLHFELEGSGPWTVQYSNGTETFTFETTESTVDIEVSETAEWTALSVASGSCDNDGTGQASTYELSTVEFLDPNSIFGCEGEQISTLIDLSGQGPWLLTYSVTSSTGGVVSHEISIPFTQDILNNGFLLEMMSEGTYSLQSIHDENGEVGVANGSKELTIYAIPGADIQGGGSICEGEESEITVQFTGDSPWTLNYSVNGQNMSVTSIDDHMTLTNSENASYTFHSVVTNDICSAAINQDIEINVLERPAAILSGGGGFYENEAATLVFDMTGVGPWTVSYSDGSESYSFTTDDAHHQVEVNAEATFTVNSVVSNGCSGEVVGSVETYLISTCTITTTDQNLCEGESTVIELEFTGSAPWNLEYFVNNQLVEVQNITTSTYQIAVSEGGTFSLESVTGGNNRDGEVSGSVSITFNALPTAEISGGGIVCEGETAQVMFELTGQAPWTVNYSVNGESRTFTTDDSSYSLQSSEEGNYKLLGISDASCANSSVGSMEVSIETQDLPTATLSGNGAICSGNDATLDIDLTGVGPWSLVISNGVDQFTIDTDQSSDQFLTSVPGTYTIVSVSSGNCSNAGTGSVVVEELDGISSASTLTTESTHCAGTEVLLILDVPGSGNYEVDWNSNGSGQFSSTNIGGAIYVSDDTDELVEFTATISNQCETVQLSTSTSFDRVDAEFTIMPEGDDFLTGLSYRFVPVDQSSDSYVWKLSDGSEFNSTILSHIFDQVGNYTLTLEATKGECTGTFSMPLTLRANTNIYIPSVFNPESTNPENRVVKVYGEDVSNEEFAFQIYNRWGLLLYSTSSFTDANQNGWNGLKKNEPQENGVFTYVVRGKFNNGEYFEETGTVTMVK